jgi:WD40 repeat protein
MVFSAHSAAVNTAAFAPDARSIVSAGDDRDVHLWDPRAPKAPLLTVNCHVVANRVAWSARSGLLCLPLDDGSTKIFSARGALVREVDAGVAAHGRKRMVAAAAWRRDDSVVFSAGWDLAVFGWRVPDSRAARADALI